MKNKQFVLSDLDALEREFSLHGECVGVFGSATTTERPEDVDVFIRTTDTRKAKKRIQGLPLVSNIAGIDVNGYRECKPKKHLGPPLHVVLVTTPKAEQQFRSRSRIFGRAQGWSIQ